MLDFEFVPSSGGRRIFLAISSMMANNELLLTNLVHKFYWRLPDGAEGETVNMSESTGVTVHMKSLLLDVSYSTHEELFRDWIMKGSKVK